MLVHLVTQVEVPNVPYAPQPKHHTNPLSLASHIGIVNVPSLLSSTCDFGTHSVRLPSYRRKAFSVSPRTSAATSNSSLSAITVCPRVLYTLVTLLPQHPRWYALILRQYELAYIWHLT